MVLRISCPDVAGIAEVPVLPEPQDAEGVQVLSEPTAGLLWLWLFLRFVFLLIARKSFCSCAKAQSPAQDSASGPTSWTEPPQPEHSAHRLGAGVGSPFGSQVCATKDSDSFGVTVWPTVLSGSAYRSPHFERMIYIVCEMVAGEGFISTNYLKVRFGGARCSMPMTIS